MECAFKQNLLKERLSLFDMRGGCDLFRPMITTQGICHTFNGVKLSDMWRKNEVMDTFEKNFRTDHVEEYFQGAGQAEGEKSHLHVAFSLDVLSYFCHRH